MVIQSLSVVIPNKECVNNCRFCCSKMHSNVFSCNQLMLDNPHYDKYYREFVKRLAFARDNGCNTLVITGNSEPTQNKHFLSMLGTANQSLSSPFRQIEMQTAGSFLDRNYLSFLRNHVGVTTISLSLSSFSDTENWEINQSSNREVIYIDGMCQIIKDYDLNLRLSLNMSTAFSKYYRPKELFNAAKELGANQVTIRHLYAEGDTEQAQWVRENGASQEYLDSLVNFVQWKGKKLNRLEYGRIKYSIMGMGVVIDCDCMGKQYSASHTPSNSADPFKFLILYPDCHLYSQWDDEGSLIF